MRRRCRICSAARRRRRCSRRPPATARVVFVGARRRRRARPRRRRLRRRTRRARWRAVAVARHTPTAAARIVVEPLGRDRRRSALRRCVASPRPIGHPVMRRLRMIAAVARQGFALCAARDRSAAPVGPAVDRSLEPLLPGIPVGQRRDGARRRADSAAAGQRPHRAHHRRERHRQGARRARHPRRIASQRRDVPALQLHDDGTRSRRQPAVRPSPRQLHRRRVGSAGPGAVGRRRHAVPRRDRRPAARRAAEAAAVPRAVTRSCRSARRGRSAWTCACSRRPTPTSNSAWPKASSARICTTA